MQNEKPTPKDLCDRLTNFCKTYFLIDSRNDKQFYYALTDAELKEFPLAKCGIFLNLVMDGELEKAWDVVNSFKGTLVFQFLSLVHPQIALVDFIKILNELKVKSYPNSRVLLTAGRPFLMNGVYDFTPLFPFLLRKKELFIDGISYLYEKELAPSIYNLCLAEYYYQKNELLNAEVFVSKTIKEFDTASQRRLLFVALYLQSKILIANGKNISDGGYIKQIRQFVKEEGELEFSNNLDAAEAMLAFYDEGGVNLISSEFLKSKAPDEFANFSMLDTYSYMVKIRCYIVSKKFTATIALAEKLRPLLHEGHRQMDLCELDLLLSICFYRSNEKELCFAALERALKIAKRRGFYRLVADEGEAIFHILVEYANEKGESPFLMQVLEMARNMAIHHPLYLKPVFKKNTTFTNTEMEVLKLLEHGKSKEEISQYLFVSVNTVKFHLKNIYSKLESKSAHQAVWEARVLGVI
ncbi:helix-turn-helix transcriptional regulator [Treponema zioleckii]|uniref:helix-turn-helix transcriptional regulator n=1 Tax=Treponema zioleckii TaxID=331680 RepID=UPI00168A627A|nr:helix-turn-helix transcriptional regulator [Treponema zioleckii]